MRVILLVGLVGCGFSPSPARSDAPAGSGVPADADREASSGEAGTDAPRADAPAADAPMVDAATFDVNTCPATYTALLSGQTTSRYRLIIDGQRAWDQSAACGSDLPGATHLAVLDTVLEQTAAQLVINSPPQGIAGNAAWVGGVQGSDATTPGDGWIAVTGGAWTASWSATGGSGPGGSEPDDGDGTENGVEQFVGLSQGRSGGVDYPGTTSQGALCECDGKPVSAAAAALIAGYKQ